MMQRKQAQAKDSSFLPSRALAPWHMSPAAPTFFRALPAQIRFFCNDSIDNKQKGEQPLQ